MYTHSCVSAYISFEYRIKKNSMCSLQYYLFNTDLNKKSHFLLFYIIFVFLLIENILLPIKYAASVDLVEAEPFFKSEIK